jgi:hypothetical protein
MNLARTHTGRIASAIFLREVAIFGCIIKGTRNDIAAFSTRHKIGGIETIGIKAMWTGIKVNGDGYFFFLPAFKGFLDRWKGAEIK